MTPLPGPREHLSADQQFESDLASSLDFERSLPWRELAVVVAVVLFVVARQLWWS